MLVDTNIVSHALTPNKSHAYGALFRELENDFSFWVSGFTHFEILRSSDRAHIQDIVNYLSLDFGYIGLSEELVYASARLAYLYNKHISTRGRTIGTGDIINGACSITQKEVSRHRIKYVSTKQREITDTVYGLHPDLISIKESLKAHKV